VAFSNRSGMKPSVQLTDFPRHTAVALPRIVRIYTYGRLHWRVKK
jgi:hypothetical protein